LERILRREHPHAVVHLAAVSFVPDGEGGEAGTLETNVTGSQVLLEGVLRGCPDARILLVSSGEVYGGMRRGGRPLNERHGVRPKSLYGVSKAAMELVGAHYRRRHRLDLVIARPFNHIGPGQSPRFVASSFARQVAEIEAGRQGVLKVGNLDAERDFTDVRDVAQAYLLLLGLGRSGGLYNVCSGRATGVGWLLDRLRDLSNAAIQVETDRSRVRRKEVNRVVGDNAKIRLATGWRPEVPLETSLSDILGFWRNRAAG
jgi:GDP-4-dehydro-6-deoxy-D-mannose reductase